MNDMNNYRKIKIVYALFAVILLSLGVVTYLVFRRGTYLHLLLPEVINIKLESIREPADNSFIISFIKYYIVDFLWGLSLNFSLYLTVDFRKKTRVITVSVVSALWGLLFELAQLFSAVKGTFDFIDILMYILAAVSAALINIKILKKDGLK